MTNLIQHFKKNFFKYHSDFQKKYQFNDKINFNQINFDIPNNLSHGHISTNALFIYLKSSTIEKTEIIKFFTEKLQSSSNVEKVEIAGQGFINIFFKKSYLISELININKMGDNIGKSNIGKNKKINIEFISANPTGPLHLAHSRGAIFGDVLSNILEKVGYEVTREYYINDAGVQIEKLGDSLYVRYCQLINQNEIDINEMNYPGDYLINIAKLILQNDKKKWLNVNTSKRKKYFENFAIKHILKIIKKDCKNMGIKFDLFVSEKKIIKEGIINGVFKKLKKDSLLYEGVLEKPKSINDPDWEPRKQLLFKSTKFGDDSDRPFLKSNNDWTYFANDSAYHYYKIKRKYNKIINIWGADHIGYIKRMKSIVKVMSDDKIDFLIKICQLVNLKKDNKPIKMSKRSGNYISIDEIIKEVGSDVLRFFMLYRKNDTQIDFDLSKVLEKTKDNPIFYIQYAFARSNSVLNNANKIFKKINYKNIYNLENHIQYISDYEWKIINKILIWPNIIENAASNYEPHKIIYYLEDLSSMFHIFWNKGNENKDLRFIDENNYDKTLSRLYWINSFQLILKSAFDIIGIKPIKKM